MLDAVYLARAISASSAGKISIGLGIKWLPALLILLQAAHCTPFDTS